MKDYDLFILEYLNNENAVLHNIKHCLSILFNDLKLKITIKLAQIF